VSKAHVKLSKLDGYHYPKPL